jgi:hypothetical protein
MAAYRVETWITVKYSQYLVYRDERQLAIQFLGNQDVERLLEADTPET